MGAINQISVGGVLYDIGPEKLSELAEDKYHRLMSDDDRSRWDGKQDKIQDLDEIRRGALTNLTLAEIKEVMKRLPDGAAVAAQVAVNTAALEQAGLEIYDIEAAIGDISKLDPAAGETLVNAINKMLLNVRVYDEAEYNALKERGLLEEKLYFVLEDGDQL